MAIAEARPAPFAKFRLSTQETSVIVQPNLIHSFLYEASFVLKNVSSHLCGSRLTTEFQNSKGNSGIRNTDIKINCKLFGTFCLILLEIEFARKLICILELIRVYFIQHTLY